MIMNLRIRKILPVILAAGISLLPALTQADVQEKRNLLPFDGKELIDFHVHVAGLGYGNSGCFVNDEMRNNFRFRFYLMAMGTSLKELEKEGDQVVFKKISDAITESKVVNKAVILSLD